MSSASSFHRSRLISTDSITGPKKRRPKARKKPAWDVCLNCLFCVFFIVLSIIGCMFDRFISQHAATVTSPAWLAYSLPMVLFSFLFIPEQISTVTYPSAEFFYRHRVMTQGCQRTSSILNISVSYFTGCKKTFKKCIFSRVFHWLTSRFRFV